MPRLTLFALQDSRAFRVTWTALELGIPIRSSSTGEGIWIRKYDRIEGKKAVPELAQDSGYPLGKSPVLFDDSFGDSEEDRVVVTESDTCVRYLVDNYTSSDNVLAPLIPVKADRQVRADISAWMSFSETLMTHALPIMYARWFAPAGSDTVIGELEKKMSANVIRDLDLVEQALEKAAKRTIQGGNADLFLSEYGFSAADVMVAFSVEYVLAKKSGTDQAASESWPRIRDWLTRLAQRPAYKTAVACGAKHDLQYAPSSRS